MKYFLLLILIACSSNNIRIIDKQKKESKLEFFFELMPGKVRYESITVHLEEGMYYLKCEKRSIPFYVKEHKAHLYLVESYFSKLNQEKCTFRDKNLSLNIVLNKKKFPYKEEKLNVDKKRVFLSKKDLDRVIKERKIKKEIYANSQEHFLFNDSFIAPLKSYITSYYGNRRLFNNKKRSQHLGNDLRAAVGVKIPVMNRGKVVYVGDLFYSGKLVVVDHGLEIYSMYGHLSKTLVNRGDIVDKADIVGLAGATGRVSGPHLHWGVRIQGHWVDGFSLVEESQKQF
ncbi:MAG: M23 family metallopeptidase [Bacteriovoracaceae bacterium]|jgi:murein DD-endopeptidase MepM/ murein hydrolase activator NlpD|nr:M23 family metallopeptidase [Bacteriovoracaceae bacterium]